MKNLPQKQTKPSAKDSSSTDAASDPAATLKSSSSCKNAQGHHETQLQKRNRETQPPPESKPPAKHRVLQKNTDDASEKPAVVHVNDMSPSGHDCTLLELKPPTNAATTPNRVNETLQSKQTPATTKASTETSVLHVSPPKATDHRRELKFPPEHSPRASLHDDTSQFAASTTTDATIWQEHTSNQTGNVHGLSSQAATETTETFNTVQSDSNIENEDKLSSILETTASMETSKQRQLPVYTVQDLNPELSTPWCFVGRVLARNPVRSFKSWRGSGSLFEVYATDISGAAVRVTIFNDGVTKFYDALNPGTIHSFSNGRIKTANSAFAPRNATVELTFGGDAHISEVTQPQDYPEPVFPYCKLIDLPNMASSAMLTACGMITEVGALKKITTRAGKQTSKREFLLVDDSNAETLCTVWGQVAEAIQEAMKGDIVLIKDGQISDYMNVRSINIGIGSVLLHQPATARSADLQHWFAQLSPGHSFDSLHG